MCIRDSSRAARCASIPEQRRGRFHPLPRLDPDGRSLSELPTAGGSAAFRGRLQAGAGRGRPTGSVALCAVGWQFLPAQATGSGAVADDTLQQFPCVLGSAPAFGSDRQRFEAARGADALPGDRQRGVVPDTLPHTGPRWSAAQGVGAGIGIQDMNGRWGSGKQLSLIHI